jgi:HEPN domain-containing protein
VPDFTVEDEDFNRFIVNSNFFTDPRYREISKTSFNDEEIEQICNYLENPTKHGIWYLNGKWNINEGFSKYIKNELDQAFKDREEIQIQSGKREITISLNKKEQENIFRAVNKMTFIFQFFIYLYYLENKPLKSFTSHFELYEIILEIIDTEKLQEEFKDAYEYFKTEVYLENLTFRVQIDEIVKVKGGFFILAEKSPNFSIVSLFPLSLEKLKEFFIKLGTLSDCHISPVFSPEEKVFKPYFSLLGEAYTSLIDDDNIERFFKKAIEEYSIKNYPYCVSTIGLIAEDYLTQIFETFFREICPKGLTLGQIYDLIHNKIKQQFDVKPIQLPDINPLYNEIKELTDKDEASDNKEILKLMREFLNYIREDKKHTKSLINSLEKKSIKISVFPKILRENINELIKFRNATSHKSRIPIGNYEALRTVYCCITLIVWWNNEKRAINWKDEQKNILKESTERNVGSSVG